VSVRIQVVFYSMYGHIYRMAEAVVEGAREVEGAEVSLYQVAELVPEEALERSALRRRAPPSGTFQLPRLASLP
jgi:NAD(P)H dehydrogenase (quinone)